MALVMHPFAALLGPLGPGLMGLDDSLACSGGRGELFGACERQTKRGWTLTVPLPGLSASDVTVEARKDARHRKILKVHALPRFEADYVLPHAADLSAASASLIDGRLRVAVPFHAAEVVSVPVAEGELAAAAGAEGAAEGAGESAGSKMVTMNVPGFGASALAVTADPHALTLTVEGRRAPDDAAPAFSRVFRLKPDSHFGRFSAAAKDGVLRLSLPRRAPEERAVPVSADRHSLEAVEGEEAVVCRCPVPGVSADCVAATVVSTCDGAPAVVKVSISGSHQSGRRGQFHMSLPEGAAAEGVRAACCDGLLAIVAPIKQPDADDAQQIDVPISTTTPASVSDEQDKDWTCC